MSKQPTNRLIHEKSPYLLQHAHNPVDWFAWGDAAFEQARSQNKLVLLSIGYATCHWCHVMERESFEDEAIAAILNANFISIKVDREERPDVDRIYMRALQLLGQHGGWPLNMFLLPDLKPITGGTYFPPQPMHGRPSFAQALQAIQKMWTRQPEKITESALHIFEHLSAEESSHAEQIPDTALLERAVAAWQKGFDDKQGGFLFNGPNKFPPSMALLYLMRFHRSGKHSQALKMATDTLKAMRMGGIYDQIGGGLSRYATDHNWLVPHFEKMLYDNALFAQALIEAYRITGNEIYHDWCLDVFDYIQRDMTSPDGAFYSAEDADSEGVEGKFYVWDYEELQTVLGDTDGLALQDSEVRLLLSYWNATPDGNFEGQNILYTTIDLAEFATANHLSPENFKSLLGRVRPVLLNVRSKRIRPLCDDKIILSWNALMISAFAQAALAFTDLQFLQRATRALDFILQKMYDENGQLLRRYRDGEARFLAGLTDYALLAQACLDVYRAGNNAKYMVQAYKIAEQIDDLFLDADGQVYDTRQDQSDLIYRSCDSYDGVEPAGLSATVHLWQTLAAYGFQSGARQNWIENIFRKKFAMLDQTPIAHAWLLLACHRFKYPDPEIAIVTPVSVDNFDATQIRQLVDQRTGAWSALAQTMPAVAGVEEATIAIPLLENRPRPAGTQPAIYVCTNFECQQPVQSLAQLQTILPQ